MNVFCEAESQAHRLSFKSPILLYDDFQQLTTLEGEYYRADTLDLTFDPAEQDLGQTLRDCATKRNVKCAMAQCC